MSRHVADVNWVWVLKPFLQKFWIVKCYVRLLSSLCTLNMFIITCSDKFHGVLLNFTQIGSDTAHQNQDLSICYTTVSHTSMAWKTSRAIIMACIWAAQLFQGCQFKFVLELVKLSVVLLPLNPGGRLNKKDGLTRYGNSHVKDKTS